MNYPQHVPTPGLKALEAEVEARKARKLADGKALQVEQLGSIVPESPEAIPNLGDLVAPAVAKLSALQERFKAFYDEIRPKIDAAPQTVPCGEHPGILRTIDFDMSCQETRARGEFTPAYGPCPRCTEDEDAARRRRYWSRHGVPSRVLDASFANFETGQDGPKMEALSRVKAWSRRRTGFLLLVGTAGTGKGHLGAACLRANGSGLWIEHVNMLADLRTSYQTHTTDALVTQWQDAEMFVLDEFGLSPGGRDEEPLLYQVLADRYDKRRPTIITSNLERPAMRDALGFRLLDRIREDLTEVSMRWGSYRTERP